MAVGDVNLAWRVGDRIRRDGTGFVFAAVRPLFEKADVVLANLECSLSDQGDPWPNKEEHFAAPPVAVEALKGLGVTAVSMANNHSLDFGRGAMLDSVGILDRVGIGHVGAGADADAARAPFVIERNGLRLAVLSYVVPFSAKHGGLNMRQWEAKTGLPGVAIGRPARIGADMAAARSVADAVVVIIHSGGEFKRFPQHQQQALAHAAIDGGADLVIGHGPHNLQGYERGRNTLIAYSMGNFVFDDYTGRQNDSAILDVTLGADGVRSVRWIPIEIEDGLPRPATDAEAARITSQIEAGSGAGD